MSHSWLLTSINLGYLGEFFLWLGENHNSRDPLGVVHHTVQSAKMQHYKYLIGSKCEIFSGCAIWAVCAVGAVWAVLAVWAVRAKWAVRAVQSCKMSKKLYRLNLSNQIYSKKNAYIATNLTLRLNEIEMNGYFWGGKAEN